MTSGGTSRLRSAPSSEAMRRAQRLAVVSARAPSARGLLASLMLHAGAAGLAATGLFAAGAPTGPGEPQAIAVVFAPGLPAPPPPGLAESRSVSPAPPPDANGREDRAADTPPERAEAEPSHAESAPEDVASESTAGAIQPVAETAPEPAPEPDPPQDAPGEPPRAHAATAEGPPVSQPPPPPPPPPRNATKAQPSQDVASPSRPGRPGPSRAQAPTAETRGETHGSAGQPAGRSDVAGPPATAAEAAPILVSNPGFRRPPTPPSYPRQAVARGIEGTVLLRALIGPDGETIEIRIHRSSGAVLLDQAAVEAVRHWAFRPALVGGRAVPAWVEVPVRFRLD